MSQVFWPTMAQVAATFTGFVFVGFSVYLSNIREAISLLKRDLPELEEISTDLIYIIIFSNFAFYFFPLLLALVAISEQRTSQQLLVTHVLFIILLVGAAILLKRIYQGKRVTELCKELRTAATDININDAWSMRRRVHFRVKVGSYVLFFNFIVVLGLYILHLFSNAEFPLRIWATLNICCGSLFNLSDLIMFRLNNILFYFSPKLKDKIVITEQEIRAEMTALSAKFTVLANQFNTGQMPPSLKEVCIPYFRDIDERYKRLEIHVPKGLPHIPMVQECLGLGSTISFGEIRGYTEGLARLKGGIKEVNRLIEKFEAAIDETNG